MAKFTSIWGDLDVREEAIITEKPTPVKEDPVDLKKTPSVVTTKVDDLDDSKPKPTEPKPKTTEQEDPEDEYEYSEEDVDKAYGMLEEEGILDLGEDEEFDATPKGLADAVAATVRNKLQEEIASIPPVVQEFYAHVMNKGDLSSFTPSSANSINDLDMDDESNQELVLRKLYAEQGMDSDDIEEEIADVKDAGKLAKKSSTAYTVLAKQETDAINANKQASKKAAEDAEKAAIKEVDEIKAQIDSMDEIANFKLDDDKKAAFKKYLFDINKRTGKTQMQENMNDTDRRMKIAFLDFIDYSKADIEKQITTKLTKKRRKNLSKYTDSNVKNRNSSTVKTNINKKGGTIKFPSIFGSQSIEVED